MSFFCYNTGQKLINIMHFFIYIVSISSSFFLLIPTVLLFKRSHAHEFLQNRQKKQYINFILTTLKIYHEDVEVNELSFQFFNHAFINAIISITEICHFIFYS